MVEVELTMKIVTKGNEYAKIIKLPNGNFALVIGDNIDGYNIVLTEQEVEKVANMLLDEVRKR